VPEYENDEEPEDNNTVTKYVEVQSGKEFAIWYKSSSPFHRKHDVRVTPYMDNKADSGTDFRYEKLFYANGYTKTGPITAKGTKYFKQNYLFRKLAISKCTCLSTASMERTSLPAC
jgi:hypothetical protein